MAPIDDTTAIGETMYQLLVDLFPICRSITGEGVRQTLKRIQRIVPLTLEEVPTGTRVFDWTVPREWNIREAYIIDPHGKKFADFRVSNLHVLSYSVPMRARMSLAELLPHLHSIPEVPNVIPYRTSYYNEDWGFCLPHVQRQTLCEGEYEVLIDSSLTDGSLTLGELFIPGLIEDEILISTHCCHPSLCNDNLSGLVVATYLARLVAQSPRRYSYRFLFLPGSIGSITWLARNEENVKKIKHGLVLSCLGDGGFLHYKKSRRGSADVDRATVLVLRESGQPFEIREFSPYGYDERQYCSPGFNLPVGSLTRTPHGEYPEYHTSADNLQFISREMLAHSLDACYKVLNVLENNRKYQNLNPKCEPQLGRRGLYGKLGGLKHAGMMEMAMLWVLNLSDGNSNLLDIAERSLMPFHILLQAASILRESGLLAEESSRST